VVYLAIGAAFAFAASVSLHRGGALLLAITTLLTTVALLVRALWEVDAASQTGGPFGFPVLLAIVPPPVTAGVIQWVGSIKSSRGAQWLTGMLAWILTLVPIGLIALMVN